METQRPTIMALGAAALAGVMAFGAAFWAVHAIEARTVAAVKTRLFDAGITWAQVSANGLQIWLEGTAPNEASRFRAVNLTGSLIDAGRVRDRLDVVAFEVPQAPRFSVEMLRNADGLSIIGLMPAEAKQLTDLESAILAVAQGAPIADMVETADYPMPEGWDDALAFGLQALEKLPRSKISVAADRVSITAISDSEAQKQRLESDLARMAPPGVKVELDISAPRPVLTPFTLRLVLEDGAARFDACAADTEQARTRIVAAGVAAGVKGKVACTVGLGVPTPRWAEAAETGIAALASLGAGTVTFSDADVTLLATAEVEQAVFDRVVGDLEARLPSVFSLKATLAPRTESNTRGPAEFTAALGEDGRVELRGRLTNDVQKAAVDSFARARFGAAAVYTATRLDGDLPEGWPVRVIAGLESLSALDRGTLLVRADRVEVSGVTGRTDTRAEIARILSDRLGQGQEFSVDVTYDEALDPLAALPTPEECVARLNATISKHEITFEPGSAAIDASARATLDALATILKECPGISAEVAGHTDSQGSEGGNLTLSQARAGAVLAALRTRGLPVAGFTAKGYGEARPIADNATEEGRESNRRIEFTLLLPPESEVPLTVGADVPVADAGEEVTLSASNAPALPAEAETSLAEAQTVPEAEAGAGPDRAPIQMAAADPAAQDLGLTRSITFSDAGVSGEDPFDFQPSDETFPRPLRRP